MDVAAAAGAAVVAAAAERDQERELLPAAVEVVDVLDGFAALVKRSATLDGSIPLRAAQACTPLLEGNRVGMQLVIQRRVDLVRGPLGWSVEQSPSLRALAAHGRAVLAALEARGAIEPSFAKQFAGGPIRVSRGRIRLFTGLLARSPQGVRVRVSSSANRRSKAFIVEERFLEPSAPLAPIVLDVLPTSRDGSLSLEGEVATLIPLPAEARSVYVSAMDCPDAARAHVRFYDKEYFESKERAPTKKYRALVAQRRDQDRAASANGHSLVVETGPRHLDIQSDRIVARAGMGLSFRYDGLHLDVSIDPKELSAFGESVRKAWHDIYAGPLADEPHFQGSLLYLTKYVTPHPKGEPHFFVKPPSLLVTPEGWSTVIDGIRTPGFDVMRGVVDTDAFHALPLVLAVSAAGVEHRIPADAELAHLFVAPRAVLETPFHVTSIASWPSATEGGWSQ